MRLNLPLAGTQTKASVRTITATCIYHLSCEMWGLVPRFFYLPFYSPSVCMFNSNPRLELDLARMAGKMHGLKDLVLVKRFLALHTLRFQLCSCSPLKATQRSLTPFRRRYWSQPRKMSHVSSCLVLSASFTLRLSSLLHQFIFHIASSLFSLEQGDFSGQS